MSLPRIQPRLEQKEISALQRHPALEKCTIPIPSTIATEDPDLRVPLITKEGHIMDGEDIVENSKRSGVEKISCLVYDFDKAQSLEFLLDLQQKRTTLNDYCRVILALMLERHLRNRLLATRPRRGNPSNLTEGTREVRTVISKMTRVSTGNISKVRLIRDHGIEQLQGEMKAGTRSIHSGYLIAQLEPLLQAQMLKCPVGKRELTTRIERLSNAVRPVPESIKQFLQSLRTALACLDSSDAYLQLRQEVGRILDQIEEALKGQSKTAEASSKAGR